MREVNRSEVRAWRRSRLMVVGEGAAGKTSVVRALSGAAFVSDHVSTVCVDVLDARVAGVSLSEGVLSDERWENVSGEESAVLRASIHAALRLQVSITDDISFL